jgi:hypothetical protein
MQNGSEKVTAIAPGVVGKFAVCGDVHIKGARSLTEPLIVFCLSCLLEVFIPQSLDFFRFDRFGEADMESQKPHHKDTERKETQLPYPK